MQLTNLSNLRKGNLIFNEPKQYQVKNSKLKYQRVKIETMFGSKKKGPVLIETPFLFSFGLSERLSQETSQLVGYTYLYVFGQGITTNCRGINVF